LPVKFRRPVGALVDKVDGRLRHSLAREIRAHLPQVPQHRLDDLPQRRHERHTPSLPDAHPGSDRSRCAGRESNFLAVKLTG
jgi:hypothetical protein